MTAGVTVPIDALVTLRGRLAALPGRYPQREAFASVDRGTFTRLAARRCIDCRAANDALATYIALIVLLRA